MKSQPAALRTEDRKQETKPIFLYLYDYEGTHYYFTNYDEDVSVTGGPGSKMSDPQTFLKANASHTRPEQSMDEAPASVMTSLAAVNPEIQKYFIGAPTKKIKVYIWRANKSTLPAALVYADDLYLDFCGEGETVGFQGQAATASFRSLFSQPDNQIPRYFYQKTCNHGIYTPQCKVLKANYDLATTIAAMNRVNKTVSITATTVNVGNPTRTLTIDQELYEGGLLTDADGNEVDILACEILPASAGTKFWLMFWSQSFAVAGAITVAPGCKGIPRQCQTFRNFPNYGGMNRIPSVNPAVNGISV